MCVCVCVCVCLCVCERVRACVTPSKTETERFQGNVGIADFDCLREHSDLMVPPRPDQHNHTSQVANEPMASPGRRLQM